MVIDALVQKPAKGLYSQTKFSKVVPKEEGHPKVYWWFTRLGITALLCVFTISAMLAVRQWDIVVTQRSTFMYPVEIFFSVFGLMYAIIVGLLIVETHRRWYELSFAIQSEITAIGSIHDCLGYFGERLKNPDAKKNVTNALVNYVLGMAEDWVELKKKRASGERILRFQGRGIRQIIEAVNGLHCAEENNRNENDICAMQAIVDSTCELTKHHTNRIELGERGLQGPFKALVFFMSFALVGGILLFDVEQLWLHSILVIVTTVAIAGLFLLLLDIDRPFSGLWSIGTDSLYDMVKKLASDAGIDPDSLRRKVSKKLSMQENSKWIPRDLDMLVLGTVFLLGFSFWTWHLVRDGFSWWAIGTGFGAFIGLLWIPLAYEEEPRTQYYCTKCRRQHWTTSEIGKSHMNYKAASNGEASVEVPPAQPHKP